MMKQDQKERKLDVSDSSSTLLTTQGLALDNEDFYPVPWKSSSKTNTAYSAEDLESHGRPILREAICTKPNQIIATYMV